MNHVGTQRGGLADLDDKLLGTGCNPWVAPKVDTHHEELACRASKDPEIAEGQSLSFLKLHSTPDCNCSILSDDERFALPNMKRDMCTGMFEPWFVGFQIYWVQEDM